MSVPSLKVSDPVLCRVTVYIAEVNQGLEVVMSIIKLHFDFKSATALVLRSSKCLLVAIYIDTAAVE